MKKIISLGIASAVCALTAISASAAESTTLTVAGEPANGKNVTFTLTNNVDITDLQFDITTKGLKVLEINKGVVPTMDYGMASTALDKFMCGSATKIPANSVICTIVCTVTAEAGQKASIELTDKDGLSTALLPEKALEIEIKGATSDTPATSDPTSTPTSDPATPGTSSDTSSETEKPGTNPPTGVALAVVPAVLAAAGVIVAKKRK